VSAVIHPMPYNAASNVDIMVVVASSCLILLALLIGRRLTIKRIEGIVFLISYALYLFFVIKRG